jgi:hypothetical protein
MAMSYKGYHMQSTNKIIPKHPWHDCRCGFKGRFNSNVCPLSMCTPAGDGILHSPIVGDLISDSKPTVPEPEQALTPTRLPRRRRSTPPMDHWPSVYYPSGGLTARASPLRISRYLAAFRSRLSPKTADSWVILAERSGRLM